jgi:hypothetical protein
VAAGGLPAKETTMRTRTVLAFGGLRTASRTGGEGMRTTTMLAAAGLMLAAAMTGCATNDPDEPSVASAQSGGPAATASASPSYSEDPDAPIKFAKCMREHGMTWFPDPVGGSQSLRIPQSVKKEDFDAAQEACRQWAPSGQNGPKPSAEDMEKFRQMAKCMRENGVPNFPDPQPDGGISIDKKMGIDPESASFKAAEKKCERYLPQGGEKHQTQGEDGGGTA